MTEGSPAAEEARSGPVLAVFAHPDDAEICAGGTLASWASAGREVHLLILTNGDRGSQDPAQSREELARIRAEETERGAQLMGLTSAMILPTHDGELENTREIQAVVARRIREVRAETVVANDPTAVFFGNRYYNHSDHRMAGWIALDSAFPGSGNPHFFPEQLEEGLQVQDVYDVWLGWSNDPNHVQDITGFLRTKIDALACHPSQLSEGIRYFEEELGKDAVEAGKEIGVEHAEKFRVLDLS